MKLNLNFSSSNILLFFFCRTEKKILASGAKALFALQNNLADDNTGFNAAPYIAFFFFSIFSAYSIFIVFHSDPIVIFTSIQFGRLALIPKCQATHLLHRRTFGWYELYGHCSFMLPCTITIRPPGAHKHPTRLPSSPTSSSSSPPPFSDSAK